MERNSTWWQGFGKLISKSKSKSKIWPPLFKCSVCRECTNPRHNMGFKCSVWSIKQISTHVNWITHRLNFQTSQTTHGGNPCAWQGKKAEVYIDNFIVKSPDISNNCNQTNAAINLMIRLISRPQDPNDPILRKDIISRKKFIAEGKLEEEKLVLGWKINTRSLIIFLPRDKYLKWGEDIDFHC